MEKQIIVYEPRADIRLEVKTDGETVWLTQEQMCRLFGRERSVITKHIRNIFREGELPKEGYVQILHITSANGGRPVTYFNLDVIISVGYRVKSVQGTRFRQWATAMLREMLLRRCDELQRIGKLENRVTAMEGDIRQIKGGMDYLVQQLNQPQDPPKRRRIGFCVEEDSVCANNAHTATSSKKGA